MFGASYTLLLLLFNLLVSSAPVLNITTAGMRMSNFKLPPILHRPKGIILTSEPLLDYFEDLASILQVLNCGNTRFDKVKSHCFLPFFKPSFYDNSTTTNTVYICGNGIEFDKFIKPRDRNIIFDYERIPFMKTTQKSAIFIDHNFKKIVVAIRTEKAPTDGWALNVQGQEPVSPLTYRGSFWKELSEDKDFVEAFGQQNLDRLYNAKNGKSRIHPKRLFGMQVCKMRSGFVDMANRMFMDILKEVVMLRHEKYEDYQLTVIGHSFGAPLAFLTSLTLLEMGMDNQLVTFNSARPYTKRLSQYYDDLSGKDKLRSLVLLNQQDSLVNVPRGHLRVWNAADGITALPLNDQLFELATYLNPYRHSGLSIVSPQRTLYEHERQSFIIESKLFKQHDTLPPRTNMAGKWRWLNPHYDIVRNMYECDNLKKLDFQDL